MEDDSECPVAFASRPLSSGTERAHAQTALSRSVGPVHHSDGLRHADGLGKNSSMADGLQPLGILRRL